MTDVSLGWALRQSQNDYSNDTDTHTFDVYLFGNMIYDMHSVVYNSMFPHGQVLKM